MKPISVCLMQLSSCWGCYQSLLNLHLELLDVLPLLDIKFWAAVVDTKYEDLEAMPDGSIDLGIIEGQVRTKEDRHHVLLTRQKCKVVVTLGSCPQFGSVPGLSNLFSIDELVERKFSTADSISSGGGEPKENVPGFCEKIVPVQDIVPVEGAIPGCPPVPANIKAALVWAHQLFNDVLYQDSNVCESCEMRGDACILNKGGLCFGPITGMPSGQKWTAKMGPVLGEYGPTAKLAEPEAQKLKDLVLSVPALNEKLIKQILEFATLYFRLPQIGSIYLTDDLLQKVSLRLQEFSPAALNDHGATKDLPQLTKDIIGNALLKLSKDDKFQPGLKTVCAHCYRNKENKQLKGLKRNYEGVSDADTCLLEQGYLCMGIVTRAGCGALCPQVGAVCAGCYGPAPELKDSGAKFLSAIASVSTQLSIDEILDKIIDPVGTFYRFSLPASTISEKVLDKKG
ncbi:MAG: hypothetical protein ACTSRW_11060 [Candidatus Helarchaeota archaeon]